MTYIASGGVIIAAAALFIVLSVFAGLKDFSLQFSSFIDPDLKLVSLEGKSFEWTKDDATKLIEINGITAHSKIIEERIIIKSNGKNVLAYLKGVDENYISVTEIMSKVAKGNWVTPNSNDVVSGWGVSNELSFGILDFAKPLSLYVPKPGRGQASSLKTLYNSVLVNNVGLFDVNEDLNDSYVFSDISLARDLLNYENQITALELKLDKTVDEQLVRTEIESAFPDKFLIKNKIQLNDALFKMLNTEHLAIYLIFTLVIIIALFNVIGAIIMMILDRKKSLSTLFSLGTTPKTIKSIFFYQGSLMTILSGVIGITIGFVVVYLQQTFDLVMLTIEIPYPVKINVLNVLVVFATIAILGIVASKIASQRITKKLIQIN